MHTTTNAWRDAACPPAAWLALAATPVFALMGILTGNAGHGAHQMSCAAAAHLTPLSGMALMYALMSAFHCPPWLRLISRWRSAGALSWGAAPPRECASEGLPR